MIADNKLPNEFQRKALELVNSLLQLSESVFFLVEPDMQHRGAVVFNRRSNIEKEYSASYGKMDPLNPERFHSSEERVVTLDSQMAPHLLKQTIYFQEFMVPNNHRYVADMFFRHQGQIIAVLTMLRKEELGDFSTTELTLLNNLQPFLEYSLQSVYLPQRGQERQSVSDKYGLTEREIDVVELLLSGVTNKEIAIELSLGLATVKTHLHHIFQKTEVQSRSELVAKVLRDLQD
ncbi:helix-turn-helix transcriptional regulator [Amphritea balenae]|uniref:DNA-binding response regulator n=1 Tax=Amphritea balenae TaxID=452629 RepID=A0A3P1SV23_9GAMM|nr:LuxR C-terminal-related transcriptional regulator [Amphritea balenae]RRD01062.1 DNA-binding response regulator [Amphritea balenae]GGK60242.1 helix-turn-helix transcriptional regulator [Amphritea balenae]